MHFLSWQQWLTYLGVLCSLFLATARGEDPSTIASTAQRKVALVIGNAAYEDSPLRNPVNDARAVAASLAALDFHVDRVENATQERMEEAIRQFGQRAHGAEVALFYFAGHGLQVEGRNFLIPVRAKIKTERDVKYQAFDVGRVLDELGQMGSALNVVILDACRNNPFRFYRSLSRGLASIDAPPGSLLAYSTAPGSVAADGNGVNGTYTKHLVEALAVPGLKIEEVFKRVRLAVFEETNGRQVPWEASSLTIDFYFRDPSGMGSNRLAGGGPTSQTNPVLAKPRRSTANLPEDVFADPLQRQWYCPSEHPTYTFEKARDAAAELRVGSLAGWRLPTKEEVLSLASDLSEASGVLRALKIGSATRYWLAESTWWKGRALSVRFSDPSRAEIESTVVTELHRRLYIRGSVSPGPRE